MTITGFVIPSEWDRHAIVASVAILTDQFEKVVVADSVKGMELVKWLDEKVNASGLIVGEDLAGNKVIQVSQFSLIDGGQQHRQKSQIPLGKVEENQSNENARQ